MPPQDQVTLLGFNDTIFTLTRKATDPAERVKAVDRLAPWGSTALYDVRAARHRDARPPDRPQGARRVHRRRGSGQPRHDRRRRAAAAVERRHALHDRPGPRRDDRAAAARSWSGCRCRPAAARSSPTASTSCTPRSPICSTSCRISTCSATRPTNTQARRRVAEDQGGRGRPPRRARAAGLPRAGGQMTITTKPRRPQRRGEKMRSRLLASALPLRAPRFSLVAAQPQQPPPTPRFQSSVEVTSLDVTVVDDKGKPIVEPDAGRLRRPDRRQRAPRRHAPSGCRCSRRGAAPIRRRRPTATAPTRARPAAA